MTKLTPIKKVADYVVILRAIHERGGAQREALTELGRRGLWLTAEQRQQAGLARFRYVRYNDYAVFYAGKSFCSHSIWLLPGTLVEDPEYEKSYAMATYARMNRTQYWLAQYPKAQS